MSLSKEAFDKRCLEAIETLKASQSLIEVRGDEFLKFEILKTLAEIAFRIRFRLRKVRDIIYRHFIIRNDINIKSICREIPGAILFPVGSKWAGKDTEKKLFTDKVSLFSAFSAIVRLSFVDVQISSLPGKLLAVMEIYDHFFQFRSRACHHHSSLAVFIHVVL